MRRLVLPDPNEARTPESGRVLSRGVASAFLGEMILLITRTVVVATVSAVFLAIANVSAYAQDPRAQAVSSDPAYRIGAEDILEISVWKDDALKKDVLVRPDGGLSFPLVGDIQAAGKTVSDIRDEVTKRLARYIPDPVVSVTLQKIGSHRVYVIGKVNKPGDFPVGRYIDVLQALAMAGGLTPFAAADDIKIIRRDGSRSASLPFQYSRVERGQNLEQNIVLRAGDVVVVP